MCEAQLGIFRWDYMLECQTILWGNQETCDSLLKSNTQHGNHKIIKKNNEFALKNEGILIYFLLNSGMIIWQRSWIK